MMSMLILYIYNFIYILFMNEYTQHLLRCTYVFTHDGHTASFGKLFATVTVSENQKKVKLSSRQVPRER